MLAIERRSRILSTIQNEQSVIVSELAKKYKVTEETIRRDLDKLSNEGYVTKTYGGAVFNEAANRDLPFRVRESSNKKEKVLIAKEIVKDIKNGTTLMLDSSSTVLEIGRLLKNKERITVITNSVEMLIELSEQPNVHVISTGGNLRESSLSLVGKNALDMIRGYHVDLAIISCKGVDIENGITDSNELDAELKMAMIKNAKRFIVAADSKKLNKTAFVKLADLGSVPLIVTCRNGEEKWTSLAEKAGNIVFAE